MADMNEDYVSYELALALKACGFDEPCRCCYAVDKDTESNIKFAEYASRHRWNSVGVGGSKYPYKHISAPTLWHAQKWLREKKELYVNCFWNAKGQRWQPHCQRMNEVQGEPIGYAESYEGGLSTAITAALELIKKGE